MTKCIGANNLDEKDGVLKQLLLKLKKYLLVPLKHSKAKRITDNALVIEKSTPNIFMVTNDRI